MEFRDKLSEDEMNLLRKEWTLAGVQIEEEMGAILLVDKDKGKDDPIYPAAYCWIDEQWRLVPAGMVTCVLRCELLTRTEATVAEWLNKHSHTSGVSVGMKAPTTIPIQIKLKDDGLSEDDTNS